jgi:hypothetical protein
MNIKFDFEHPYQSIVFFVVICSIVAWTVTQIIKPFVKKFIKDKTLHRSVIRVFSVIAGTGCAYFITPDQIGLIIGFCSGSLNALVVKYAHSYLQSKLPESVKKEVNSNTSIDKDNFEDEDDTDDTLDP